MVMNTSENKKFKDISADISLVYNNDKDEPVYRLGIANNY